MDLDQRVFGTQLFFVFIIFFLGKIGYQKTSGQGPLIKYPF